MIVTIEPTTPADVAEFFPRLPPWGRICALTVRVGGRIVGIGGYYYNTDGTRVAFVEASEADCRKHRIALAKAARKFFDMAEAQGVTKLCAEADLGREAAARWLHHLGFNEVHRTDTKSYWLWQKAAPVSEGGQCSLMAEDQASPALASRP